MEEFQERLNDEAIALCTKVTDCCNFILGDGFSFLNELERRLLLDQYESMVCYLSTLNMRIDFYGKK